MDIQKYQQDFEVLIQQPGVLQDGLKFLESKTQVKRSYIAYGTAIRSNRRRLKKLQAI